MILAASALLHLYPFKTVHAVTEALKFDLIAISVSIGFTVLPFCVTHPEAEMSLTISFLSIFLQLVCVQWQFRGHVGLDTPAHSSEVSGSESQSVELRICFKLSSSRR